jgi:phosphohistidine phosphatase
MRTLHLLRHAKSSWDDAGLEDQDRPLAPRGERAATLVGVYLAQERVAPDLVLCSSARRAVDTWQRVAAQLPRAPRVRREDSLYAASAHALLDRLRRVDDDSVSSLVLVGHEPGLGELARGLAAADADAARRLARFPTTALATFAVAGAWSDLGRCDVSLTRFVRPSDLV